MILWVRSCMPSPAETLNPKPEMQNPNPQTLNPAWGNVSLGFIVNPKDLETGLRPISAGIPYT